MRPAARLLAAAGQSGAGNSVLNMPLPLNLMPPIPLYRRLLRAHRKFLAPEHRVLGDEYIKSEFRLHRNIDNPAHLLYAQKIEGDSWEGEQLDPHKVAKMTDQQIGQLYELMTAIRKHRESGGKDDDQ